MTNKAKLKPKGILCVCCCCCCFFPLKKTLYTIDLNPQVTKLNLSCLEITQVEEVVQVSANTQNTLIKILKLTNSGEEMQLLQVTLESKEVCHLEKLMVSYREIRRCLVSGLKEFYFLFRIKLTLPSCFSWQFQMYKNLYRLLTLIY